MEINRREKKKVGILLVFVGVYFLGVALVSGQGFLLRGLMNWGLWLAIATLFTGPFVWIGYRNNRGMDVKNSIKLLGLAAFILLMELQLLLVPRLGWLSDLSWNWQGKLASLAVSLIFVAIWSGLSWKEIGFALPRPGSWLRVATIIAGVAAFWFLIGNGNAPLNIDLETLLFQASMPGLEEELIYRGILWVLIARALPGTKKLWGANVGWSLIITTILFALIHGVTLDNNLSLVLDPGMLIFTGAAGFVMGWVRAYSGSILPAIVLHNSINLLAAVIPWLLS